MQPTFPSASHFGLKMRRFPIQHNFNLRMFYTGNATHQFSTCAYCSLTNRRKLAGNRILLSLRFQHNFYGQTDQKEMRQKFDAELAEFVRKFNVENARTGYQIKEGKTMAKLLDYVLWAYVAIGLAAIFYISYKLKPRTDAASARPENKMVIELPAIGLEQFIHDYLGNEQRRAQLEVIVHFPLDNRALAFLKAESEGGNDGKNVFKDQTKSHAIPIVLDEQFRNDEHMFTSHIRKAEQKLGIVDPDKWIPIRVRLWPLWSSYKWETFYVLIFLLLSVIIDYYRGAARKSMFRVVGQHPAGWKQLNSPQRK